MFSHELKCKKEAKKKKQHIKCCQKTSLTLLCLFSVLIMFPKIIKNTVQINTGRETFPQSQMLLDLSAHHNMTVFPLFLNMIMTTWVNHKKHVQFQPKNLNMHISIRIKHSHQHTAMLPINFTNLILKGFHQCKEQSKNDSYKLKNIFSPSGHQRL